MGVLARQSRLELSGTPGSAARNRGVDRRMRESPSYRSFIGEEAPLLELMHPFVRPPRRLGVPTHLAEIAELHHPWRVR